jgi:hypothetical protein
VNQDDDRWRRTDPPVRGPSAPPTLRFDPLATGLGVFVAVALPIAVVGFTRATVDTAVIAAGVVAGLLAGVLAGLWVASRGGEIWRGPRL